MALIYAHGECTEEIEFAGKVVHSKEMNVLGNC